MDDLKPVWEMNCTELNREVTERLRQISPASYKALLEGLAENDCAEVESKGFPFCEAPGAGGGIWLLGQMIHIFGITPGDYSEENKQRSDLYGKLMSWSIWEMRKAQPYPDKLGPALTMQGLLILRWFQGAKPIPTE